MPTGEPKLSEPSAERALSTTAPRMLPFNALFGNVVFNTRGEALGTLNELLLDLHRGRIAYAVVSSGGFMGKGERFYAVPWAVLSRDAQRHCFVVPTEKEKFVAAPAFDKAHWPSAFDPQWHLLIHQYYGSRPYWI